MSKVVLNLAPSRVQVLHRYPAKATFQDITTLCAMVERLEQEKQALLTKWAAAHQEANTLFEQVNHLCNILDKERK